MADAKLDINVREALGVGGGVTPKHGGLLRRPTEAAFDGLQEAGKTLRKKKTEESNFANPAFGGIGDVKKDSAS